MADEELSAERARLWAEVQARRSHEADLHECRARVAHMEGSLSWRITRPLRRLKARANDLSNRLRPSG